MLLGNVYERLNDDDKALESFARALQYNPEYMHAHLNMARVYREKRGAPKVAIPVRRRYRCCKPQAPLDVRAALTRNWIGF